MATETPEVSLADRARFAKGAKQVVAYANFLRWAANFKQYELISHDQHREVVLLSAAMSARFCFAIMGETLMLGVQSFEAAWLATMPFEVVHVSDRLYLRTRAVSLLSEKMPDLTIGIYVNDKRKLAEMARMKFLQPVRVEIRDGQVVSVGMAMHIGIPIVTDDLIKTLTDERKQRLQSVDIKRYF